MTRQCERCGAVRDDFAALTDGELSVEESAQVAAWAVHCPLCAEELRAQKAVRQQLQAMGRRQSLPNPPARIWTVASQSWKDYDGRRLRRTQIRFALIAACMVLLLFGAVWARLKVPQDFPVNAVLYDFAQARRHSVKPAYVTMDADQAARWLRSRLNAELPPVNLRLSRATLVGADVVTVGSRALGRLLYRTPHSLVGVYIAPGGTDFGDLPERIIEGETFRFASDGTANGLYGWRGNGNGYGVALPMTEANQSLIFEVQAGTHQTGH